MDARAFVHVRWNIAITITITAGDVRRP
eukprot:SAG31_NODE_19875_length_589_cov_1.367347_2_plen_27_part_01